MIPKHSTCENSRVEIMYEDLSIIDVSDDINILDINIQNDDKIDPLIIEHETPDLNFNLEENTGINENMNNFVSDMNMVMNKEVDNDQYHSKQNKIVSPEINIFKCDKCDFKSTSVNDLQNHRDTSHFRENLVPTLKYLTNKIVEKGVSNAVISQSHSEEKQMGMNTETKNCAQCKSSYLNKNELKLHMERVHYYSCEKCEVLFNNKVILNKHFNSMHVHSCKLCNYKSMSEHEIKAHSDICKFKENVYICGDCGKSFDKKLKCITHMDKHDNSYLSSDPVPTFPCDECNNIYVKISELKSHKSDSHNNEYAAKNSNVSLNSSLEAKIDSSSNIFHKSNF